MTVSITGTGRETFDLSVADIEDGQDGGAPIINVMIEAEPPAPGQEPVIVFEGLFTTTQGADEFEREVVMAVQGFRQRMQAMQPKQRQMSDR